eukprot:GFUD01061691.1.p1 GENE.GFUD01061691.1~~GFUD01061691.1.p1  ORF type:complete len:249 (-),score=57.73 GFUD01061691.1:55-801(-)
MSSFFHKILLKNPHQHPLLYLKGVKYENILSVLNFMYHGEVNVAQEDLNSFLAVAEDLQVKGLTQNNPKQSQDAVQVSNPITKSQDHLSSLTPVQRTHKQQKATPTFHTSRQVQDTVTHIKTEGPPLVDCEEEDTTQLVLSNEYQTETSGYEDYGQNYEEQFDEGLGQLQGQMGKDASRPTWNNDWSSNQVFSCDICFKTFSNKKSLQNHAGSHTGKTTCAVCQKVFSTTTNLNQHMRNAHPTHNYSY